MKPASSSARTRRQQGAADSPTREASSVLVSRASVCSSFRMATSNLSNVSIKGIFQQYSFVVQLEMGMESKDISGVAAYTLHTLRGCSLPGDRLDLSCPQGSFTHAR